MGDGTLHDRQSCVSVGDEDDRRAIVALGRRQDEAAVESAARASASAALLRELELHASALEAEIARRDNFIQSILRSPSWRVTEPLRILQRAARQSVGACKEVALASYRHVPKAWHLLFRLVGPAFRHTSTYQDWSRARQAKGAVCPAGARPLESDCALALPLRDPRVARRVGIAVLAHIADERFAVILRRYLDQIPFRFDLFVTADSGQSRRVISRAFSVFEHAGCVRVGIANAGAATPFADVPNLHEYDYVLNLGSLAGRSDDSAMMPLFILENLTGSQDIVNSILSVFETCPDVGLIASQHFEPTRHLIGWPDDFASLRDVARGAGFDLSQEQITDFPSAGAFWARPAVLTSLARLAAADRVAARLYYHACESAGFRWLKVAHPPLFDRTPAIRPVTDADDLAQVVGFLTINLTRGDLPSPRVAPVPEWPVPQGLIRRLHERALGIDRGLDPDTRIAVGIVALDDNAVSTHRAVSAARRALDVAGLASQCVATRPLPRDGTDFGAAAAHNELMRDGFASGAALYIGTLAEGMLHPDAVTALARMALAHRGRALIEGMTFPGEHAKSYDAATLETAWASSACFAVPREVYQAIGDFDGALHCEHAAVDFSWRARINGFEVLSCPTAQFLSFFARRRPLPSDDAAYRRSCLELSRKWGNPKTADRLLSAAGGFPRDLRTDTSPRVLADWRQGASLDDVLALVGASL